MTNIMEGDVASFNSIYNYNSPKILHGATKSLC